jgi:hypothetical protein
MRRWWDGTKQRVVNSLCTVIAQFRVSPRVVCGQSGKRRGFSWSYSVFPCQYHSTVAHHTHVSYGGWYMSMVAVVQRHTRITPSTWTTRFFVHTDLSFPRTASTPGQCLLPLCSRLGIVGRPNALEQWSPTACPRAPRCPRRIFWVPARTFYKFYNIFLTRKKTTPSNIFH